MDCLPLAYAWSTRRVGLSGLKPEDEFYLDEQAGATGLDSLDLRRRPWHSSESGWQFAAVKVLAFRRLDRTQRDTWMATNRPTNRRYGRSMSQWTMLLGFGPIRFERIWQRV